MKIFYPCLLRLNNVYLYQNFIIMKALRIVFLLFIMIACSKEDNGTKSVGTITGFDARMCMCCGGWIININDVVYLIDSMPKDSEIDVNTATFPITVELEWKLIDGACSTFNRISVKTIKRI